MSDYLSKLPVEVFIYQITFLPFKEVQTICTSNTKLHSYCTDERYKNYWRNLIENTFSSVYGYEDKLKEVRNKLGLDQNAYNYLVYVHLIDVLDPLTQLMIYYKQKDMESFNSNKYNDRLRYWTMFLLRDRDGMLKYSKSERYHQDYMDLLDNKPVDPIYLDVMIAGVSAQGNVPGTKYFLDLGASITPTYMSTIAITGGLNTIRYLLSLIHI